MCSLRNRNESSASRLAPRCGFEFPGWFMRGRCASWLLFAAALGSLVAELPGGQDLPGPPTLGRFEFSQPHMGTWFRIVLYAPDQATATRAADAAFDRIRALDDIMSDYRPNSELMLLSERAGGPAVGVSEDLFRVLRAAQETAKISGGAFDITVGPVVRLWRRARRRHELPDRESLARALELVGYEKLSVDMRARTAQLAKPGMLLDLGGIAKGDAADEAMAILKERRIASALVAGGGDIAVSEPPPGSEGWRIGIAPLGPPNSPPKSFLMLRNAAVSTSGDAEQHVEIAGIRYSHIIDPKTGIALTGRSSVTVVAPDCTASDSLATAVSVLGPERGLELIKATRGAGVLFIRETSGEILSWEWNFPPPRTASQKKIKSQKAKVEEAAPSEK